MLLTVPGTHLVMDVFIFLLVLGGNNNVGPVPDLQVHWNFQGLFKFLSICPAITQVAKLLTAHSLRRFLQPFPSLHLYFVRLLAAGAAYLIDK